MKKAIFVVVGILIFATVLFSSSHPAYACADGYIEDPATGECVPAADDTNNDPNAGGDDTSHGTCEKTDVDFLSFPTWYRGLDCDADDNINIGSGTSPSKTIFTIALNVVDIMIRLAGILAVGFMIWGGIRYILARGEPEKAKDSLDTIMKAAMGLALAMISATVVSFVVWRMSQ